MYKISKLFTANKKEDKEKKSRIRDSKGEEKVEESPASKVVHSVRNQIQDFKVNDAISIDKVLLNIFCSWFLSGL